VRADGRWRSFSAPDPLLSNDVRALAYDRDKSGIPRLWVGSDKGLQTFDGRDWQDLTEPEPQGVRNDQVTALWADEAHGTVWVGAEHGLNWQSRQGTWQTHDFDGVAVRALAPDGEGGVYVGTDDTLWHCLAVEGQALDCQVRRSDLDQVRALLSHKGVLWVGTADGLKRISGAWLIPFSTVDGLVSDRITALAVDTRNRLWVGTEQGITLYDETAREKWRSFSHPVRSLAVDSRDRVWAATDDGLLKWDPRWEDRDEPPSDWQPLGTETGDLPDDRASLVCAQPNGVLWTVTGSGLSALDGNWDTYRPAQIAPDLSLLFSEIYGLVRDEATGELWVSSNVGVSHYVPSTDEWDQTWTTADGLGGRVYALLVDTQTGDMTAGTSSGVSHYDADGDTWRPVGDSEALGDTVVWDLAQDPETSVLWAGTDDGLMYYDPGAGQWARTMASVGESGEQAVYRLVRDPRSGELWLGTLNGVIRYDPQTRQRELYDWPALEQAAPSRPVELLRESSTGEMWVALQVGQILYHDGQAWDTSYGSALDELYALARDPLGGTLWAGTASGVYRYTPYLGRWAPISTEVGGILGKRVLALARDEQAGVLWAGTQGNVVRFSTASTRAAPWARVVRALSEDENVLRNGNESKLLDAQSVVYQFEGGSFVAELGELRYGYRIEGIDAAPKWTTPDQGLEAPYDNLAYGGYTFALWAQDGEGRQSEVKEYALSVQASPTIALTHILGQKVSAATPLSLTIGPGGAVPVAVAWSDPDDPSTQPASQYGWFERLEEETYIVQEGETLSQIARRYGVRYEDIAQYNGLPSADQLDVGQTLRIPIGDLPDALCTGEIAANCWVTLTLSSAGENRGEGDVQVPEANGAYKLLVRAVDAQGNPSARHLPVHFQVGPIPVIDGGPPWATWAGILAGVLIVVVSGWALRTYPDYASSWGGARGYPVQQLIPLIAPLNDLLDIPRIQDALQARQAYTTKDQVQIALEALERIQILRRAEGGNYRFAHPFVAWVHRMRYLGWRERLAEAVRSHHPLYADALTFFDQAGFRAREVSAEAFLLEPETDTHPQASYGTIYARLVAGRALEGDDFEDVYEAACVLYGDEVRHRLAFVILNVRPTPGARLRLYEIRQSYGLAIVTLDREIFGQVKPNMPASDILSAQIDQSTGRQNLYAISGPVSDDLGFFGRDTALQQLIDLIDAGQMVGVFGLRKTGKTSLLQRLRGHLATRRVIASLDMQGTAREEGTLPLYASIVGAFVNHIRQYRPGLARSIPPLHLWPPPRGRTLSIEIVRVFADDLRDLYDLIGGDERLLLILDEVDRLLPMASDPGYEGYSTFLGQLRAANQGIKVLDVIVAGVDPSINRRDKWGERDNELYKALQEVWMPPMGDQATREMIESIGSQMGFQYEPGALERIVRAGGGQPFLTRQICSQIVSDLLGRGAVTITEEQAREGIEEYVYLPDTYITELWGARLDVTQRLLLLHLAQFEKPVPRAELLPAERRQAALANLGMLEERTIVGRRDGGYVIGWGILRDWIRWIELGLEN
jgi:ligand-binding sensor domain-containing protein/murein DD-endopeptidase MepM/ murein hydrolase activator NlpD/ABC-type cobalamin/Fe3+-siderophores transport system ATPase subunit